MTMREPLRTTPPEVVSSLREFQKERNLSAVGPLCLAVYNDADEDRV